MRGFVLFTVIFSLLVVGGFAFYLSSTSLSHSNGPSSTQSSLESNGIKLQVSIFPTTLNSGNSLNVTVDEINTLPRGLNVSVSNNWAMESLIGPCKGGMFNILIFNGNFGSSNISLAIPLSLSGPGLVPCPSLNFSYYTFQPSSDLFVAHATSGLDMSSKGASKIGYSKYYSYAVSKFVNFQPGYYTLAAGDQWGNLCIEHFTVF